MSEAYEYHLLTEKPFEYDAVIEKNQNYVVTLNKFWYDALVENKTDHAVIWLENDFDLTLSQIEALTVTLGYELQMFNGVSRRSHADKKHIHLLRNLKKSLSL